MASLSTLASAFEAPGFTPEEWREISRRANEFERREAARRRRGRVERSGIPHRYLGATLEGCPPEVRRWCSDPSGPLMLRGEVGLGKTWTACAALIELAAEHTVLFRTLRQMADDVRTAEYRENPLYRCQHVGVLCIDDLGKDEMTRARLSLLFEVVKARDEGGRPTIYTTNYPWPALLRRLMVGDDASLVKTIASRLQGCVFVDFAGADRRRHE